MKGPSMHVSSDDVAQIVQEVWSSMLGLEVEPLEVEIPSDGPSVAGSVGVSGASDCLISMELSETTAKSVAASMFGLAADEVGDEDIADAVGELTNMVGGNIKSLLPEPSTLSLPVVAHGVQPIMRVVGGEALLMQTFVCEDRPIFVRIWNRSRKSS